MQFVCAQNPQRYKTRDETVLHNAAVAALSATVPNQSNGLFDGLYIASVKSYRQAKQVEKTPAAMGALYHANYAQKFNKKVNLAKATCHKSI